MYACLEISETDEEARNNARMRDSADKVKVARIVMWRKCDL